MESLCRVLDIPIPRSCLKRTQPTQQINGGKEVEEYNIETCDIPVHETEDNPIEEVSATTCENGLGPVKVCTLTTGTFDNESIVLSSFGTPSAQTTNDRLMVGCRLPN